MTSEEKTQLQHLVEKYLKEFLEKRNLKRSDVAEWWKE